MTDTGSGGGGGAESQGGAGARRVLLAEDDLVNGGMLREILVSAGYHVAWARDGEEALAFIAPDPPDLFVLDLMMPKIDGFEVCARLKGDVGTRHIPVLVITAIADQASRIRAIELGADDYIVKPVDRVEVITRARALIRTKLLNDEVQAQLRSVKRLEEIKRHLVQFLVHDLQNPLTAVMANVQIAQREALRGHTEALGPSLDDALTCSRRMHELLQSLLDVERLEEGRLQVRMEPVDVVQVVESVLADQRGTAAEGSVALTVEIGDPVTVTGDQGLLRRVLANLVGNAIRFAPENSTVRIRVSSHRGRAIIAVTDEGPGVPRAIRNRIFERYHQAGSARERGGAGLGLTFCKLVVEAHGGQIWVQNDREEVTGATFLVGLPLQAGR
ncbi:MAG: response regulator [Deltaproteobacteria bacterium]|nr:response regulator [Deltaproteobacteria bacterium]